MVLPHTLNSRDGGTDLANRSFWPFAIRDLGAINWPIGQSSTIVKVLQIYPGVVDNDFTGEIKLMDTSPLGITVIPSIKGLHKLPCYLCILCHLNLQKEKEDRVVSIPPMPMGCKLSHENDPL